MPSRAIVLLGSVVLLSLALAPARLAAQAQPVGVRSAPITVRQTGLISIAAAAGAVPPSTADDGSLRGDNRAEQHEALLQSLIDKRLASLSAAARAALSPPTLPVVPGFTLAEEGGSGFAGLSNVDQASVNFGYSVEPPDQALCVGNGFIFEGVNDAFAVYTQGGRRVVGPVQANAFFGIDFSLNMSDPKCIYDPASNRWFVTMIEYDSFLSSNHLEIAVSQTGDPRGNFVIYEIDVTNDGSDFNTGDCPCLGDQPLIGVDANGLYISTNAFGVFSFEGAQVYALSKGQLVAGGAVAGVRFDQLSFALPDVEFSFSIQPSTTPPGAKFADNTEFLAQSMRAHKAESRLAVWTVNNTSALNGDTSKLSMSVLVTPSQVYVQPVPARQRQGPTPLADLDALNDYVGTPANEQSLDGTDQRLSQVMYAGGKLWTALGTASHTDTSAVRDAVAWFVISVSNGGSGLTASVATQGYIAGPAGSQLLYPAMAVTAGGQAAMVFTLTGDQFFPSAAFWKFGTTTLHMLAEGKAPQDGFSAYSYGRPRWGDYSAAAAGPDGTIWMATEMIPGGARLRAANWGTFIGRTQDTGSE